ncbi:MAG: sugar ABC transporter permease [Anaerolineae bacterium]|nr:sugar ABC transporter permease [Anaerolineae bacterium]
MATNQIARPKIWRRHIKPSTVEALVGYLCISPWIVGFLVFTLGAMLASLGISFLRTDMLTETKFVGLNNYVRMSHDPLVRKSLINTAYYSFAMVPLGTVIALVIALLLNQGVKFQGTFRTIYYLPSIVSGVAVAVLWAWLYNPELGLINAVLAKFGIHGPRWIYSTRWAMPSMIIMSLWGAGGSMLIFLAGLQGIPTALYEAATIDGAGAWRRFWHITIPLLTPTIFFSVVMRIIGSWQIFTQAYVMTAGGPNNATLTVVLYLYRKAFEQFHFGYASAIAWVLFFIILGFTLIIFKSSELWVFYESELK